MFVQKVRDLYFGALYKLFGLNNPKKPSIAIDYGYYMSPLSASRARLDPNFSYMLLHASFGDKWCILSFVPELLKFHPKIRILASRSDRELIRVFLGLEEVERHVVFLDDRRLTEIFNFISDISIYSNPISADIGMLDQTDSVLSSGFPSNKIRHLHIVKYPYFSDLLIVHGVPYSTLIKMLMYLPASVKAHSPQFYSLEDREIAKHIVEPVQANNASLNVLFNIVNFSNKPLSIDQIDVIVDVFNKNNIKTLLNITQHKNEMELKKHFANFSHVKIVEIPAHLLALVCGEVSGVIGVIGGAMNVAAQFSSAPCLSFYTDPLGSHQKLKTTYGGLYGDNIWKMYDIGWNCFLPGRYLDNIDIGDPANLTEADLRLMINNFCKAITKEQV